VIIVCISAMLLNIAAWIAIQTLLPLPLFTLFWIAEAIWQTKSRSLS
jgi:ABC-type transport system involved in Fe-S cluster assembly fused permease/ATPase subunit